MITNPGLGTLLGLLPSVMLAGGACLCALVAVARPATRHSLYRLITLLATVAAFTASMLELGAISHARDGVGLIAYEGGLMVDRFHVFGTVLVCVVLALTVLGSEAYTRRSPSRAGAFCALLQVAAAAAMMLFAQREMVAFMAAFTVLVVALTILTSLTKTSAASAEAAFKQVLVGGVAMATAGYGMTLIYAATGTTDLGRLLAGTRSGGSPLEVPLAAVGMAMVVIGILVVAGTPPLRGWLRAVEGSAPGPVAGFAAALGVVTATGILGRYGVEAFGVGRTRWTLLVTVLAAVAMLSGGVLALRASSIRRLIAHLSMAQAGFLLLAVGAAATGIDGTTGAGSTALLYALMGAAAAVVAAYLVAGVFETAGLAGDHDSYRGVGRRAPATAAFLAIALLGLAGLPPLAGFIGRVLIAEAAANAGVAWAAGVAAISTVLTAAAALRWLAAMYGEDSALAPFTVGTTGRASRAAAWSAASLGVLVAAFAGPLISLAGGGATALH